MGGKRDEFAEFLRALAVEARSEGLAEVAQRLAARHRVATQLQSLAEEGLRIVEEFSAPITPGVITGGMAFDFVVVTGDIAIGIALVSADEGSLSRDLLAACVEATATDPSPEGVVFVWMTEDLPSTGMNADRMRDHLDATSGPCIVIPKVRIGSVADALTGLLSGLIKHLSIPRTTEAEPVADGGLLDVSEIVRESLLGQIRALSGKRFILPERKAAAESLSPEDAAPLLGLVEEVLRAETVEAQGIESRLASLTREGSAHRGPGEGADDPAS